MRYFELIADLTTRLSAAYDEREAAHLAREVVLRAAQLSRTQLALSNRDEVPEVQATAIHALAQRLLAGEPWQYVTGEAEFCGHSFAVGPGVLIPRPETELLVELALAAFPANEPIRVLDACTGSGCIAHSIALARPGWQMQAFDLSDNALAYARLNAERLGSQAHVFQADALRAPEEIATAASLDILVSNPPYIPISEHPTLSRHVRDQEPGQALFVPDEDPLLFYKALERLGRHALRAGGRIALEVHAPLAEETKALFLTTGWHKATLKQDTFGRNRVVAAERAS